MITSYFNEILLDSLKNRLIITRRSYLGYLLFFCSFYFYFFKEFNGLCLWGYQLKMFKIWDDSYSVSILFNTQNKI